MNSKNMLLNNPPYKIELEKKAQKDLLALKKNKKLLLKALLIIDELTINPYSETHKFERLKHNYSGFYSKRLDKKNRIIYRVVDDKIIVIVLSVLGHYDD
jgi:toxin YoeB